MNFKGILSTVTYTVKKHSPEILLGVGITGMVVSTGLACRATLKCEAILDEHKAAMTQIDETLALEVEEYTEVEAKKDILITKRDTVIEFVKLYGPSVTLMGASIACILGSYRIMNRRQVALMAAYKMVEEAFSTYRGRVVKELGAAKDAHFMYGTNTITEEETIVDENGKKKKVTNEREELVPGAKLSGFAREFKEEKPDQYGSWTGSTQWSPVHDYNLSFLVAKEKHFNDKLVVKGFVTINEVLEELGFVPSDAGMVCGWKYKSERGDGYISFRPKGIDGNWMMGRDGDSIILDFNCEGLIYDEKKAIKELTQ